MPRAVCQSSYRIIRIAEILAKFIKNVPTKAKVSASNLLALVKPLTNPPFKLTKRITSDCQPIKFQTISAINGCDSPSTTYSLVTETVNPITVKITATNLTSNGTITSRINQ